MRDETKALLGLTSGWAGERGREGARKMTSLTCSFEEGVQPPPREDRYTERGDVGSALDRNNEGNAASSSPCTHNHVGRVAVIGGSDGSSEGRACERACHLLGHLASRSLLPSFLSSSAAALALRTSVTKPFPIFVRRRGLRPRCDGNADAARSCMPPRGRRRRGEAADRPGSITE